MKPTLFGYGLTTKAIAKKLGGGCTFFDDNTYAPFVDELGNRIYPSTFFDPTKSALEIVTPSLKPHHNLATRSKNFLSEYDLFLAPQPINDAHSHLQSTFGLLDQKPFTIYITGTNGKTTTTQMLTHLLQKRGAINGGNIGTPLADLNPSTPIWVLETSSFTLHHTKYAVPDIFVLLPITPDHLDWHGSMQDYIADKLSPLMRMKEGSLALIPSSIDTPRTDAWVVRYDENETLAKFFDLDAGRLHFKGAFLQDALLAMAVARTLFDEADYDLMNLFEKEAHRQEEIIDTKGRLWINDSKATNLDATLQAINAYDTTPLHLIVGGDDKGVDLTPFFETLKGKKIALYAIGSNEEKLIDMAKKYGIKAYCCGTLDIAVKMIDKVLDKKDVALLSPAASSLDQFRSYKERGELFKKCIESL